MNEIMRTYVEGVVANRETASSAAATAAITATTPTAAITTTGTTGTAATDASTNTATAATTQAPYMVSSKLPVGFRPGLNALYHYPDTNTPDKKEQGTSL
jgi:hypothetical protein